MEVIAQHAGVGSLLYTVCIGMGLGHQVWQQAPTDPSYWSHMVGVFIVFYIIITIISILRQGLSM